MAVSANRLELLQIADAVAREKVIDKQIVLDAMADAIAKAARSRYGAETDIHAEINGKTGELRLSRHLLVVDDAALENDSREIAAVGSAQAQPGRPGRRRHFGDLAAVRFRPHRGAIGQAGHRPESARRRARPAIPGIQGSHRRSGQRRRQARRIRQRDRRSRPWRGHRAPRRDDPARNVPSRRPHPRVSVRRAPRSARPAGLFVAHPSAIHGQALRPGSAGDL